MSGKRADIDLGTCSIKTSSIHVLLPQVNTNVETGRDVMPLASGSL